MFWFDLLGIIIIIIIFALSGVVRRGLVWFDPVWFLFCLCFDFILFFFVFPSFCLLRKGRGWMGPHMAESMPASSLTVLKFIENAQNVPQSVCFLTEFISVF